MTQKTKISSIATTLMMGYYSGMTNEELERLKNTNIDFSAITKAAIKVDPAKVKEREEAEKKAKKPKA